MSAKNWLLVGQHDEVSQTGLFHQGRSEGGSQVPNQPMDCQATCYFFASGRRKMERR